MTTFTCADENFSKVDTRPCWHEMRLKLVRKSSHRSYFQKSVDRELYTCRMAVIRRALQSYNPDASNGGSNLQIQHSGADIFLLKSKFRLRMSTFASLHRLETLHFALSFRKKLIWRFVCGVWRWLDVRWMAWCLTHPTVGQTCESDTLVLTWKLLKSPNRSRISTLKFI